MWTPPFTSIGPICLRGVGRRVPRPVCIGPKAESHLAYILRPLLGKNMLRLIHKIEPVSILPLPNLLRSAKTRRMMSRHPPLQVGTRMVAQTGRAACFRRAAKKQGHLSEQLFCLARIGVCTIRTFAAKEIRAATLPPPKSSHQPFSIVSNTPPN